MNGDHYLIVQLGRHQKTLMTSLSDDVIAKRYDEYGFAMVVADGIGTSGSGEKASRVAVTTLMHLVLHFGKWNLRIINDRIAQEVQGRAERFYRHIDNLFIAQSETDPHARLQTTLTAAFGAGKDLFLAHVGHSRAYVFRHGVLSRLTRDHTVGGPESTHVPVAPLVNVVAQDLEHLLTETIGMSGGSGPKIDIERFQLHDGDRILLCTNGLTDMIAEEAIAGVLASGQSPKDQSSVLVDLAMAAGGADDITALIALYRIPE
jgi:serine/threonine protein phosphatase PrpC